MSEIPPRSPHESGASDPQGTPASQGGPFPQSAPFAPGGLADGGISAEDRQMAMLAHLLAIFTGFLGPLIIWLVKKDQSAFVDDQGKEALNFQLTMLIASLVSVLLVFVVIGIPLLFLLPVLNVVFCILAAVAANRGERYRYPICLRMVS